MRTQKITCRCGAEYELTKYKLIMRDKDSKDRDICGETLIEWNGGVMYSARLLKAPDANRTTG